MEKTPRVHVTLLRDEGSHIGRTRVVSKGSSQTLSFRISSTPGMRTGKALSNFRGEDTDARRG